MSTLTEERVREIAREEALRVYNDSHPVPTQHHPSANFVTHTPPICGLRARDGRVCTKEPKHGQRHRYSVPVKRTPPPDNGWRDIPSFALASGARCYEIKRDSPVKVKGFGKGGGWQTGWYVTRIQKKDGSTGDLGNINVEVNRDGSHTRTVRATKIGYVRPSSKAGRASVKR